MLTYTGAAPESWPQSFQITFSPARIGIGNPNLFAIHLLFVSMARRSVQASTFERIRAAALDGFARQGVGTTSIRDIAEAAGVSPGLIQHYFPSKAALRGAVDKHVTELARETLKVREVHGDPVEDIAQRLTALVGEHFLALLYVARGVAEQDEAALAILDTLTGLCREQLAEFQRRGMLRPDLDLEWAALHTLLINLGTVIMEPGVSRQLGRPFLTKQQLDRWRQATTALFVAAELQRKPE